MIPNPEHVKILSEDPLNILPLLLKDKKFNIWPEKADYIRNNVNQEIIKSSYLILVDAMGKLDKESDFLLDKYLDDLDIFWCALTNENAAKIELMARN